MKNAFYFILKALFVLKIFKFLSWLFGHAEKTAWLEREGQFQNSWRHNFVKKQLQYLCCPIYLTNSIQPDNETWSINRLREIFFFENYEENEAGRLSPDLFLFFEYA